MDQQRHRLGFLAMAFLVASMLISGVSTMWFEQLGATSAVTTGTLDAGISCTAGASGGAYTWTINFGSLPAGTSASCTYSLTNPAGASVPWHVDGIVITVLGSGGTTCSGGTCTAVGSSITASVTDSRGCQVHPGSAKTGTFTVTANANPASFGPATAQVVFEMGQWNESPYAGCLF